MNRTLMIGATIVGGLVAGIAAAVAMAVLRWNIEAAGRVARLRVPRDAGARPYVDGMTIPTWGEVEGVLPEGSRPYFRARIVNVQYDFAPLLVRDARPRVDVG